MFLHPVDYGRKAEELLWRKVYYEVIQVIKTNKKVLRLKEPVRTSVGCQRGKMLFVILIFSAELN